MNDSAWQEYKILQDKVDRIADFRFRIKSWMVTIVLALSFGGYATGRLPTLAYAGLVFLILMFYLFEHAQASWHNAFINRLIALEKDIAFMNARADILDPDAAPLRRIRSPAISSAIAAEKQKLRSSFRGGVRFYIIQYSHGTFYLMTLCIVVFMAWLSWSHPSLPVVPQYETCAKPAHREPNACPSQPISSSVNLSNTNIDTTLKRQTVGVDSNDQNASAKQSTDGSSADE